jgi:hypothetical protein
MPGHSDLDPVPQWRAASRCNNGDCVEVALLSSDTIGVRDNKNSGGPVLRFSVAEWNVFIKRVREAG